MVISQDGHGTGSGWQLGYPQRRGQFPQSFLTIGQRMSRRGSLGPQMPPNPFSQGAFLKSPLTPPASSESTPVPAWHTHRGQLRRQHMEGATRAPGACFSNPPAQGHWMGARSVFVSGNGIMVLLCQIPGQRTEHVFMQLFEWRLTYGHTHKGSVK